MKKILFPCLLLLLSVCCFAQNDSTTTKKIQLKLGMNYNSNLHYYGRTDSLPSSGFFPTAELWFGESWYLNASPIFVHNKAMGTDYAGSVATLGYLKATEKSVVHLYALKPFYKEESRLVQSAMQAQAGAAFSILSKIINVSVGGDVKYSNQFDYGAMASVDHLVRIQQGNSIIIIDPTLAVNAGTQNFLRTYRQKKGGILFPREEQVTEKGQMFRVLSVEASVPVILVQGKFQLQATPAYVVPKNLLTAADNSGQPEYGKPLFYTTVGIKYSF